MNDFLLDQYGDLAIQNGDFVTGNADEQNIAAILKATKGSFVQFPLIGCAIDQEINGHISTAFRRIVQLNFAADGYNLIDLTYLGDKLSIDYD